MSGPQRKELALVDSSTASLTDKALFIINNKVRSTVWSNIYNLFKQGYDTLYATTAQLANYVTNSSLASTLTNYATTTQLNAGLAGKQNKQAVTVINIDAQTVPIINSFNCILSITNFSSGTGNKTILFKLNSGNGLEPTDFLSFTVKYGGHNINLRSYNIELDNDDTILVSLYLNIHSNPTEPVIISMNKIN